MTPTPGTHLGRYEVLGPLGKGGMGEVYRARDPEVDREVAIKVLPADVAADAERLARFEREAKALAALQHPNVATLYGLERQDGQPFLVMELVSGETLAERIAHGPLSPEELLSLAVQIAEGLTAAHEAGIVHRDLKPANLLMTRDGQAKILDFGLAKLVAEDERATADPEAPTRFSPHHLTGTGVAMGTVSYMSPEQARGQFLDQRSDLFSLGTVFYEMATGRRAFAGATAAITHDALLNRAPPLPATVNPELPAELQAIILKCLEKDPALRYQSAAGLRGDLVRLRRDSEATRGVPTAGAPSTAFESVEKADHGRQRWALATVAIGVLLTAVAGFVLWPRDSAVALTEADPILLTAFDNRTGDPVFDDTLETALAVKIDESPFLNVVSDQRVREGLELMQQEPGVRIDEELGRDLCRRLELKAMIHGEIVALGEQYVVTLHTIGCRDGETLARVQREASRKEQVLAALGEASTQLRSDLGESLKSLAEYDTPIEQATTSSLDALEAYSRGWNLAESMLGANKALPHLERAVELDPTFAMAHRKISVLAGNNYATGRARDHATLAYEYRDRASTPERLAIEANYHGNATGNLEKTIRALEILIDTHPSFEIGLTNLGFTYRQLGQFEKALEMHRLGLERTPGDPRTRLNFAIDLLWLGRLKEAQDAIALLPAYSNSTLVDHGLAVLRHDEVSIEQMLEGRNGPFNLNNHGELLAQWGRLAEAVEWMERGAERASRLEFPELSGWFRANLGWYHLKLRADEERALSLVREGLDDSRETETLHTAALTLAAVGLTDEAKTLADEMSRLQPEGTILQEGRVPHILAAIEIQEGRPGKALELLESTTRFKDLWASVPAAILRGRAHLDAGDAASAEAVFLEARELRFVWPHFAHHALVPLYLARARALQGKTDEARQTYEQLFDLWRDADPDFGILIEARRDYAALETGR